MLLRAEVRLKGGELARALEEAGWSQSELARRVGCSPTAIGSIINLKKSGRSGGHAISAVTGRPSKALMDKVTRAFVENGISFDEMLAWPDGFTGLSKEQRVGSRDMEVDHRRLAEAEYHRVLQLEAGDENPWEAVSASLDSSELERCMPELREREQLVVRSFMAAETLDDVGRKLGLSRERVRRIRENAFDKLRGLISKAREAEISKDAEQHTSGSGYVSQQLLWDALLQEPSFKEYLRELNDSPSTWEDLCRYADVSLKAESPFFMTLGGAALRASDTVTLKTLQAATGAPASSIGSLLWPASPRSWLNPRVDLVEPVSEALGIPAGWLSIPDSRGLAFLKLSYEQYVRRQEATRNETKRNRNYA